MNISFNFGTPPYKECASQSEAVRVSFGEGCCAAFIGRISLHPKLVSGSSVFLEGDPTVYQIQHEFMHVLGAWHQNQSPAAKCENELKIDVIVERWKWPREKVIANVAQLNADQKAYFWSAADDKFSITRYDFDPDMLVHGRDSPCFSQLNSSIDDLDYLGLRLAYPMAVYKEKYNQSIRSGVATGVGSSRVSAQPH